ncbi:hypothetical protein BKA67DRAFT_689552 [Truncatella angustata]|uniref:Uncharacterized protein n=1 Tax=Truncatella angustata TaxID=152316 RepID=A0A9P8UU53_9PEZI|nr:uncharacterized protein BKA67DRAFT_689552 [Truncatella angustata]KAH6658409.1 hypothetical protein BKA67DRAFT_689552 [Truncatella angustata]
MSTFSAFTLTPEEILSFETDLQDLLSSIHRILNERPSPLSVYDWSEALRLVRDAFMLAVDMHALLPESDARLVTLFRYKGDCLRGLGRRQEARDAYLASRRAEEECCIGAAGNWRLGEEPEPWLCDEVRSRRLGRLWSTPLRDEPDLGVLGYKTELWDPEPPLLVGSAECWPRRVEGCTRDVTGGLPWSLSEVVGGFVGVRTPVLRSRKGESIAKGKAVKCAP